MALFASGPIDEVELLHRAEDYVRDRNISFEVIRKISHDKGVDFATAVYFQFLKTESKNKSFIDKVNGKSDISVKVNLGDAKVLLVPGLFHSQVPEAGVDGRLFETIGRDKFGLPIEKVAVDGVGSVEKNAQILAEKIANYTGSNLWLTTVSKGTLEARYALNNLISQSSLEKIKGWLSFVPFYHGCAIVDAMYSGRKQKLKAWISCKATGVKYQELKQIKSSHPFWREDARDLSGIPHFACVAVPFSSHIRKPMVGRFRKLSKNGPNDGMVDLLNCTPRHAQIYPVLGVDHFFRGPGITKLMYNLCGFLQDQINLIPQLNSRSKHEPSRINRTTEVS